MNARSVVKREVSRTGFRGIVRRDPMGGRRQADGSPAGPILYLHRSIGNRGVQKLPQRKNLTEEEKKVDLQSDSLKDDPRLQKAYDNEPLMKFGETSEGVKTLQRALQKLGYALPASFAKTGDADGIFGSETYQAVRQFQTDHTLVYIDGIVGRETLQTMDTLLLGQQNPCRIKYKGGILSANEKSTFLRKNFFDPERPAAEKILNDLCDVGQDVLSFETEQELRDEIMKRMKVSQYMRESQTTGAFAYPESSRACPGKSGNALADAQANKAAKEYWNGPIMETRAAVQNRHYYFELTDKGKQNGYEALRLLFTPQSSICDKTLIHCDTLITLAKSRAYADTIGQKVFDTKIQAGQLKMWLTYDGMTIKDKDASQTPVSVSYRAIEPNNENDLVIGDHVLFWNHLGYDAISVKRPGPWRLENALLVDKDSSGKDLYEGHGAPSVGGAVKPGPKEDVLTELMNVYNSYAKNALEYTARVDQNQPGAQAQLTEQYPQVKKLGGLWQIEELPGNKDRPQQVYLLREITGPADPELIGLRNPYFPVKLNWVNRPVESA